VNDRKKDPNMPIRINNQPEFGRRKSELQPITGGGVDSKNIKNIQKAEQGDNSNLNFNKG